MRIRPLTDDGQAVGYAGVSPDGRLVAYAPLREGETKPSGVKQVATGTEVTARTWRRPASAPMDLPLPLGWQLSLLRPS